MNQNDMIKQQEKEIKLDITEEKPRDGKIKRSLKKEREERKYKEESTRQGRYDGAKALDDQRKKGKIKE